MDYKIVEMKEFKVLGPSITTTDADGENNREIPAFWQRINSDGTAERMYKLAAKSGVCYGVCYGYDGKHTFKYAAAVPYEDGEQGEFEVINIPASKWAIFKSVGPMPKAIQDVWVRIFSEWLPATDYEIAELPQLEAYFPGDTSSDDYVSEVWIPLK